MLDAIPDAYAADPVAYYRGVRLRLAAAPAVREEPPAPPPSPPHEPPPPEQAYACRLLSRDPGDWVGLRLIEILDYVCLAHGVRREAIAGRSRTSRIMRARRAYYWMARQGEIRSYPEIGRLVGVDHTSVLHGVRRLDAEIAAGKAARPVFDPEIAAAVRARYLASIGRAS